MKKIFIISSLMILLTVPYAYAQMGGHRSQERMGSGMMGGEQGHMGQSGMMMGGQEMMGSMMQDMNQMTGLMRQMTDMMKGTVAPEHMKKMSDIMKNMSEQMRDMSRTMSKGEISRKEMEQIHQQMLETQKRFDMMKMW